MVVVSCRTIHQLMSHIGQPQALEMPFKLVHLVLHVTGPDHIHLDCILHCQITAPQKNHAKVFRMQIFCN